MQIKFLDDFILQSHTDNLKTKGLYPEQLFDLKVKVSFGQGNTAQIPWISILGPGMSTSNGYYPVYLYYKEQNILVLSYGISETVEYQDPWSFEILSKSTKASDLFEKKLRYRDSYIYKTYMPQIIENEVTYTSMDKSINKEEMYEDLVSLVETYKNCLDIEVKDESSSISKGLFYMEQQLEDFIIENWDETEFGKKYDLIEEEGEIISQQYKTDIGPIDILAKDKISGDYVVIELKKNQTSDDTVGQISRYMGWIQEHLNNQNVKGIIVCGKYDERLNYAQKMIPSIEVFLYEVNFSLREYKK